MIEKLKKLLGIKKTEIEIELLKFLKAYDYKDFAEKQAERNQYYYHKFQKQHLKEAREEKYAFLKFKKKTDVALTEKEKEEFEFLEFLVNKKK